MFCQQNTKLINFNGGYTHSYHYIIKTYSQDSPCGMALVKDWTMEKSGFNSRQVQDNICSPMFRLALRPIQPPIQWSLGHLSLG